MGFLSNLNPLKHLNPLKPPGAPTSLSNPSLKGAVSGALGAAPGGGMGLGGGGRATTMPVSRRAMANGGSVGGKKIRPQRG